MEDDVVQEKPGIVYFSRIPPYMQPDKLRSLMVDFGDVGRIYLVPEDKTEYKRRKIEGGNRQRKFVDGWVEFKSRKIAKRVAASLNGTTVGGKKRHNFYRDDLWSLEYLAKFKWEDIKEQEYYNRSVRKARLGAAFAQARRENDEYLENVDKAKVKRRIQAKRGIEDTVAHTEACGPTPKTKSDVCSDAILSKLFG